jgi:tRNA A37 threonylcarbamoyladenosine modification protein TsaB
MPFPLSPDEQNVLMRTIRDAEYHHGVPIASATALEVNPGPGRFRALRLACVTANALSWALDVPLEVRGKSVDVVIPEYGRPPSIG